jgi:hypothetical protein
MTPTRLRLVCAVLVVGALLVAAVAAPLEPANVPTYWELDLTMQEVRPIRVQLPGQPEPETFWYIIYTVTNRTGADQIFVPELVLYTDTGQVLQAGRKIPPAVFDQIKQRHNDPLLLNLSGMAGKILQGRDNAKTGVAIWRDFDSAAGAFDVFFSGLSGETVEVDLPVPVQETVPVYGRDQPRTISKDSIILTKTLQRRYMIPGEAGSRFTTPIRLDSEQWIMR